MWIVCNLYTTSISLQTLLRTLSYVSTTDEPSPITRVLTVTVSSDTDTQSCPITITLSLINDNTPVVDLSGSNSPSQNHSISLTYNFFRGSGQAIATRNATITDMDIDGRVASLRVALEGGRSGDRVIFHNNRCPMNEEPLCR